ncbi:MAG: DMT family transporter, partial [bacterium]|nr:DMT family transporter [bacterium]
LPVVIIASVWAGNMILFNLGIDYTTAIASQLLYLTVPVLVLIEALLFLKESFNTSQLIGLGLGLIGGLIVVLAPSGNASFGAFKGNTLIFLGTLCWSLYIMLSRRLSVNLPSIGVLVPAVFFSWIGSVVMLLSREDMSVFGRIMDVSPLGMSALLYVGILSGVVMFILFQWGVKHGPAIVAGSTVYVSMVSGGIGAMIVLGERLTAPFVFGGVLLLGGVFLTSTLPLLEKYRSRK